MRKHRGALQAVMLALSLTVGTAIAADVYPSKPIELVVGIGAGSTTDVTARIAARFLSERLKQPVIVVNRPGAGGTIAAEAVATRAAPDGYTLLWASSSLPAFDYLYKLRFDPSRDLVAVGGVAQGGLVMTTRPGAPWQNLAELVSYAKSKPNGSVTYASAGVGSNAHLFSEILAQTTGVKFLHVPYKGSSAALTDVLSGSIDFVFDGASTSKPLVESNRIRALAYSASTRSAFLPNVPTMREAGVKDFAQPIWLGVFAPGGTPKAIVDRISDEIHSFVLTPAFKKEMATAFYEPFPLKSQEFSKMMSREIHDWNTRLKQMNFPREQ